MQITLSYLDFVPQFVPQKMNGKLSYTIRIKNEYVRKDGTCAMYLDIYHDQERRKIPMELSIPPSMFDARNQRVKKGFAHSKDYNLLIEKLLADLNAIEMNYRIQGDIMTLDKVIEDLQKPSLRINFNTFATNYLEKTKGNIKESTYKQQKGALAKIKRFRDPIPFTDINEDFLPELRNYLKLVLKNAPPTIESTLKNFKKYLRAANKHGIRTKLDHTDISVKRMTGNFTFLVPEEIKKLHEFYSSPFINSTWKNILQRYLFSCFTGLRISDIETIAHDNIINDTLAFTMVKTNTFIRIQMNDTAKALIKHPKIFRGSYTREHINRELKEIAKALGIKKRIYYHSSRHTFATNYLLSGGRVQNLQKILGHSDIKTTMVYVHITQGMINKEVKLMDAIISGD